jgi:hypothetical protein
MARASTRLILGPIYSLRRLRLYEFPLGYVNRVAPGILFLKDLAGIEIIKDDVPITLPSENVKLIVNQCARVAISTLRDRTAINAFEPSEFLR